MPISARTVRRVRLAGLLTLIAGLVLVVAGVGTAVMIREQLKQENITLHEDSPMFAGQVVDTPLDAYLQAEVIKGHAADIADGATYAELERDDPRRETLEKTAFLRASLFTSVIAFGVAALVAGLGLVLAVLGLSVRALAGPASRTAPALAPEPAAAVA